MFAFPFDFDSVVLNDYFSKTLDTVNRFAVDYNQKRLYFLINKTNGLWMLVNKVVLLKNKAKLVGVFWQQGKCWDGFYILPFDSDDLNKKTAEQIAAILDKLKEN